MTQTLNATQLNFIDERLKTTIDIVIEINTHLVFTVNTVKQKKPYVTPSVCIMKDYNVQ